MSKLRILVLEVSNAGVGKYRFNDPHVTLQNLYKEDFHIDIKSNPPLHLKEFYTKYDVVFAQGSVLLKDEIFNLFKHLQKEGLKIAVDLDDYWRLPTSHVLYRRMETMWKTLTSRLSMPNLITTTTKYLGKQILKYNKNVVVIPNCISGNDVQFKPKPIESDRVRVGFVGGSSHLEDLKLLTGVFSRLKRLETPTQMVMCGFNNQSRDINTGKITTVLRPEVWMRCESIFTNNYDVNDDYKHYLLTPRKDEYHDIENQYYRRIWTKDISVYGTCYNHIDVALAPLVDNTFNAMKSQLKVLEAGFHKKPIVLSEIAPYMLDCIDKQNAFLIPQKKAKKMWAKQIVKLVNEPNLREDMGMKLYETVHRKYNLERVTKFRAEIYKKYLK